MNNTDELLKSMNTFVTSNSEVLARFGAKIAVMSKLIEVTLPRLTADQCTEITTLFRHGIEDIMSLMDDIPLPVGYHSTLLEQTNVFLDMLNRNDASHS